MIVIRADGGKCIGLGHVMRCLSIAKALQKLNKEVHFVLADESVTRVVEERGFSCTVLNTDYTDMEGELEKLIPMVERWQPEWILVDSYYVTAKYLEAVKTRTKLVYLDDLYAFAYPVDALINYNIYAKKLGYDNDVAFGKTDLLLGCEYAPLREEFCHGTGENDFLPEISGKKSWPQKGICQQKVNPEVMQVLLTTGGSDSLGIAEKLIALAMEDEEASKYTYHVVSGAMNPHLAGLRAWEKKNANIQVHVNVQNMAELMRICDIAISAGGFTLYELAAMGIPTICFSFAQNQEQGVETFAEEEIALYGGNYLEDAAGTLQKIIEKVKELAGRDNLRQTLKERARDLADGRGCERIAAYLCSMEKGVV